MTCIPLQNNEEPDIQLNVFTVFPTTESSKPWLADSGSAKHICADRKDTLECHEYDQEERVDQYDTSMETHELPIRLVMNDETTYKIVDKCYYDPMQPFLNAKKS
jgi:hypothetical protein